jgi:SprT protein
MNRAVAADGFLQDRVRSRTLELLARASAWLGIPVPPAAIRFDLRGRAAGQARLALGKPSLLRYNPALLRSNPDDFLAATVPHEVAHVIACARHGVRIRPHGQEWKAVMDFFGAEPKRCHDYDVAGLQTRQLREIDYHCDCRNHLLTSIRHRRALAGRIYLCRQCGAPLRRGKGASPADAQS